MVEVALADELLGLLLRTRERDEVLDGYVARVVDVEVLEDLAPLSHSSTMRMTSEAIGPSAGRSASEKLTLSAHTRTRGTYRYAGKPS